MRDSLAKCSLENSQTHTKNNDEFVPFVLRRLGRLQISRAKKNRTQLTRDVHRAPVLSAHVTHVANANGNAEFNFQPEYR